MLLEQVNDSLHMRLGTNPETFVLRRKGWTNEIKVIK